MIPVLPLPFVPLIRKRQIVGHIDVTGYQCGAGDSDTFLKIEGPTPYAGTYILKLVASIINDSIKGKEMLVLVHEDEDYRTLGPVLSLIQDALNTMDAIRAKRGTEKAANASISADKTIH